jgi:hypothetical protein
LRELWCDICGKRIGSEFQHQPRPFYNNEPAWENYSIEPKPRDVCIACEIALIEAIHSKILELKKFETVI